jgi:DNA mismatch endonuclease (patch repair protein)
MMSAIRSRNTEPELLVRRFLHRRGFRFSLHRGELPGRPDIVLPKYNAVVLVHGCFWHRHPGCRYAYMPKGNRAYWATKLAGNVVRDARNRGDLRALGWRVFVVWECQARHAGRLAAVARALSKSGRR